jgi:hypothetical protein
MQLWALACSPAHYSGWVCCDQLLNLLQHMLVIVFCYFLFQQLHIVPAGLGLSWQLCMMFVFLSPASGTCYNDDGRGLTRSVV